MGIWAILFFAMLLVLGVDTEFCSVESLITGIVDNWSEKLLPHRKKVALVICVTLFFLGIPMCTNGGIYLFQIMDFYSASGLSLLWICFFETVAVSELNPESHLLYWTGFRSNKGLLTFRTLATQSSATMSSSTSGLSRDPACLRSMFLSMSTNT